MINYKKLTTALLTGTLVCFSVAGCSMPWDNSASSETVTTETQTVASSEELVSQSDSTLSLEFDSEDLVATWDQSSCTTVNLTQSGSTVNGSGANVSNSEITISSPGTYVLSGTLTDGCVHVNVTEKETVRIILNGVTITSSSNAPIFVEDAKKVLITLAEGTTNTITDSARSSTEAEDYSAAIYSKADLVFNGTGSLNVNAGYRNGIKSSDDLKFVSGTFNIKSVEDGVIGKDLLGVKDGTFSINAGSDGMKSTYDTDTSKGNVIIDGGVFHITATNDGVQAENILLINGGTMNITTKGGSSSATMKSENSMGRMGMMGRSSSSSNSSSSTTSTSESAKALKATNAFYMYGGEVSIDSYDDAVHTNGSVDIANGSLVIKSGDDGIHADSTLTIDGGTIDIQYCYEGLESSTITINGGDISVVSEDDGFNASEGATTSTSAAGGFGMGQSSSNATLTINGGNITVNATGDGLDSNGSMVINGGTIVVYGPVANDNTAIDFDNNCVLTGGTLIALGSSGMLETPTSASNGSCIVAAFSSVTANTEFSVTDSAGKVILSTTALKTYNAAIVYSADITTGNSYTLKTGSTSQSITVSSAVTTSGTASNGMGGGMQGGQKNGMQPGNAAGDNSNVGGRNAYH